MEEDCPSCLAKGIKSSVNFCQITLDSALLACSNLNCSFPFDRQYRDVIWKRDYKDINIERKPKVKLEDVTLKDVKPIDDYFNLLELPDIIPNETIESTNTTAVSSSSPSVDFSTLVALSEEDAHPLVVNDERSPDNPELLSAEYTLLSSKGAGPL
ncbi:uncharacterized protein [Anabrus simplex]|uniref:uncharacterized protein n=1 Tax=Anabrus simplex TaxID=316456 RepID=UPI0034DD94B5